MYVKVNKTGLQPVSRPVELVNYFRGWVDGGWVQSTFGAKAEQIIPRRSFFCVLGESFRGGGGGIKIIELILKTCFKTCVPQVKCVVIVTA